MLFGIGGDKQVLSIDWDTKFLRIVQWQLSKNSGKVRKLVNAGLPESLDVRDAESMGDFIRDVLDSERINTSAVIVDIPRDQSVLNTMSLPTADLDNLASMVQLQIAKELPFPLNDAVVDFAVSPDGTKVNSADVLVAAARNEVLEFYQQVCTHAGLKLERVGLRPYANVVAVTEMLGAQSAGRVLIIDVGPTMTEIDVVRDGALVFSRAASSHLGDLAESIRRQAADISADAITDEDVEDGIIEQLTVEITRSAEAYRTTDPGARFDQLVLAGNCGFEQRLASALSRRFMIKTRIYDPGEIVKPRQRGDLAMSSFAATIGLGLGHAAEGRLHFDFLHPKKPMDARTRRLRQLGVAGAVAAALVVLCVLAYFVDIYPKRQRIAELESQIRLHEKELKKGEDWLDMVELVEAWNEEQVEWPLILEMFSRALPGPEQAILDKITLSRGRITFKIIAKNTEIITQFRKDLEQMTRDTGLRGAPEEVFVFDDRVSINSDGPDPNYPCYSSMTVKLKRIEELSNRKSTQRRRRSPLG